MTDKVRRRRKRKADQKVKREKWLAKVASRNNTIVKDDDVFEITDSGMNQSLWGPNDTSE